MKFSWISFLGIIFFASLLFAGVLMVTEFINIPSVHPLFDVLNLQSLLILIAGLNLYTFAAYPSAKILAVYQMVLSYFSFTRVHNKSLQNDAYMLRSWQRELAIGSVSKEELSMRYPDTLEGYIFTMASSGYSPAQIRQLAEIHIVDRFDKTSSLAAIFRNLGNAAPSFGLMGTLFGLIVMLSNIQNAQQLSQGLAVALMTTLYGVLMSQVLFMPLSVKIKENARLQFNRNSMMLDALEAILTGRSPLAVHDILMAHSVNSNSMATMKQARVPEVV